MELSIPNMAQVLPLVEDIIMEEDVLNLSPI